ncbi:MAG: FAD-binding oxidoreductase, partial [Kiritimatiellaeota bacterium]|nr:FAD-binding oxidoreductase [Kiritimatiellota bacterium]
MSPPGDLLIPEYPGNTPAPRLIRGSALADFRQYFSDESKQPGRADLLVFPRNTEEVSAAVHLAATRDATITVSGARTGITAGAVPAGGMVLSLERMNRIRGLRRLATGELAVVCEAGVVLGDLQKSLETGRFTDAAEWDVVSRNLLSELTTGRHFYPPDPTETSASIGGTLACNASGAHTFQYGPTRDWVTGIEVVLADGGVLHLERTRHRATPEGTFRLRRRDGRVITVHLPELRQPNTKNAAGYFSRPGMDLVDLFIGSEGTLGIITRAELRLAPAPERRCLVAVFWENEAQALRFTVALRQRRDRIGVEAIEYMDARALDFLRDERDRKGAASHVPAHLPAEARGVIFLDLAASEQDLTAGLEATAAQVRRFGGDPETCWVATEHAEREALRMFRHALPESVNNRVAELRRKYPELTKLGTDMAVPDDCLERMMLLYRQELDAAGLEYVIFGHIGDNHLHINILPATPAEYARGKQLYFDFAREVVAMGGSPAAEHGIGKLKTGFLELLVGAEGLAGMRAVKEALDPDCRLGPGTLFALDHRRPAGRKAAPPARCRRMRRD